MKGNKTETILADLIDDAVAMQRAAPVGDQRQEPDRDHFGDCPRRVEQRRGKRSFARTLDRVRRHKEKRHDHHRSLRGEFGALKTMGIKRLCILMSASLRRRKGWRGGHAQRRLQIAWNYSQRSAERPSTDTTQQTARSAGTSGTIAQGED
jgi:hypothetical protein